jgi:RNA polymerase sigma-70 factor (ECF subfamily)
VGRPSFEKLVNQNKDAVYRQMIRVCNHREDAEDALATALIYAFKAYDRLESDEAFRTWLGTIGKRVCARMRSSTAIQTAFQYAEERDLIDPNTSEFDLAVLKGCVNDAVESLPPIYRDIYLACELNEKSVVEAAKELGITHNAAKSRLQRAREKVRQILDRSVCST